MFGKGFKFSFKFCSGPDNKTTKSIDGYKWLDKIYKMLNRIIKTWVKTYLNGGIKMNL